MKIGLLGFTVNDANLGCNALTYSFLSILQEVCDEPMEVCIFGKTNDLSDIRSAFPKVTFSADIVRVKDIRFRWIRLFKSFDYIFDITCGDGFSDIYFPRLVFFTTLIKIMVEKVGTPLILLPQTYGPFKSRILEHMAKIAICKSNKIYARDSQSVDYVFKLCNKKAVNTTDLAFCLPYESSSDNKCEKVKIGINISGLLWNGGFHDSNQFGLTVDYKRYVNELIECLQKDQQFEIHLIPHVIERNDDNLDGDVTICKELAYTYNLTNLYIANTPIEAKNYICKMDVFIGARMHSTIAAYSSKTPVIPFSYSRKFEGLYENLKYEYIIHGRSDDTKVALENTLNWIQNRNEIKKQIEMSMDTVDSYVSLIKNEIKDCF